MQTTPTGQTWRMFRRGGRRKPTVGELGPQRVEARASVLIEGFTADQVWAFIRPPETAVLIDAQTTRAFTVPGTGPGVGEEQCFVTLVDGKELVQRIKVIAEQPARFAEAVSIDSPVPQFSR